MKLEETVKHHSRAEAQSTLPSTPMRMKGVSQPLTPGHSTARAVTPDSRCDYIVYTLREQVINEVVAVLIETKTTQHPKFRHAVAQVTSLKYICVENAP